MSVVEAMSYLTGRSVRVSQLLTDLPVMLSKRLQCICKLEQLLQQVVKLPLQVLLYLQKRQSPSKSAAYMVFLWDSGCLIPEAGRTADLATTT